MNILLLYTGSSSLRCPLMESADGRVVARGLKIRIKIRPNGSIGKNDSVLDYRPPLTAEDLRIHAWINERLAALHRERHGLWAKVRRFLLGNSPLGLQYNRVAAQTRRASIRERSE